MPLALHRSITFWSGILVITFICWAWQDSKTRWVTWYLGRSFVIHGGAAVQLVEMRTVIFTGGSGPSPAPREETYEAFPHPQFHRHKGSLTFDARLAKGGTHSEAFRRRAESMGYGGLFLPHWLLLLAAVIPWTGLLIWRARRRKRIIGEA